MPKKTKPTKKRPTPRGKTKTKERPIPRKRKKVLPPSPPPDSVVEDEVIEDNEDGV